MGAEDSTLKHLQEVRLKASLDLMRRQMIGQFCNLLRMSHGEYYYKDARNWAGKEANGGGGRLS